MPPRKKCSACSQSNKPCDLRRPTCSRCLRRGVTCSYKSANTLVFVDQNDYSADLSRRMYARQRHHPTLVCFAGSRTVHRVLERFFARLVAGQTCLGGQLFVLEASESASESDAIYSAVVATAYADLAVSERHGEYATPALRAYVSTLQRLQGSIGPATRPRNATIALLIAIMVIDSYEVSTSPTLRNVQAQHADGNSRSST